MSGKRDSGEVLPTMERYDASSGAWNAMVPMSTVRQNFGACVLGGNIYIMGGYDSNKIMLISIEKYSPASDTWIAVAPLPAVRVSHATVVGSVI
jgi:N-acetylneuraminic acid mutarotase